MMERVRLNFSFSDLKISIPQIGKLIDYDKGENIELISEMISEVLREAEPICDIKAEYAVWPGLKLPEGNTVMQINGIDFSIGKIVRSQLRRSESAAIFLCTAGPEIGERAKILINEKDFLKGYIFDIAGSEIVEAAADLMQEHLKKEMAAAGNLITNRFSPGYCGWHVSEQHKLFSLIPENFCGIKLNDSALMQPIKSVSGVIGIGADVKFRPYICDLCDYKNCIYRKFKETK
jgi:hypothetical protein